ncbi:MAG: hypothetical protein BIP78_0565 [Candidatus Bipolaricaulis sibiricus]|uniref:Uncharacterized protein n=1 Tax=Bipolaricaulis sibiricus TaxID=2501609 RepID=A0A410FTP2_BIPS1|nr:MAG: hypothetical protein BIP78_0565 [Candidatus Bipolaricaulis sibiricus]
MGGLNEEVVVVRHQAVGVAGQGQAWRWTRSVSRSRNRRRSGHGAPVHAGMHEK